IRGEAAAVGVDGGVEEVERAAVNPRFKDMVSHAWNTSVSGFWMYKVVKRLKMLKKPFRKMLHDKGNLHENVRKLRIELDAVQIALDKDPSNFEIRDEEAAYLKAYQDALN
nr:RNA-directed DNA polymerase, eukaryota, reverse transcriptase zinc-binding domain protein [Tanacetum cinerariifolium]